MHWTVGFQSCSIPHAIGPPPVMYIVSRKRIRMSAQSEQPGSEQSREARFSTALWKLDQDWKEQADPPPPKPRPLRLPLYLLLAVLAYGFSAGPVGCVLKLIAGGRPSHAAVELYRTFYFPVCFLAEHHTFLQEPVRMYLRLWGAT